jgi:GNAT superfamily N-acetyltransferase
MSTTIRNIKPGDFPDLISMFREFALFQKEPEKMINTVNQMNADQELVTGFVAETDTGEIVAYVTYFFTYHTWSGKSMYMDDLYVRATYRSAGIGAELVNKVIEKARNIQCRSLRWQVSNWNQPAADFYQRLGATINSSESNCLLILS